METIDFANVEYIWLFGSDILQQNINELYSIEVDNTEAIPGNYYLFITGSKDGYATANVIIEIEIVFTDYNITLYVPDNALPGDFLTLYSQVIDNFSLPVFNIEVRFEVNNELLSDTWTNLTGYAKITYQISPIYQLDNLNVSCSIVINEIPLIQVEKTIKIEISEIPQEAQINSLVQNFLKETNETLFFNFTIIYPSFGKNWYISIPTGFNPIAVSIITETDVILAEIVDNIIVWRREINTTISTNDILEIETLRPQITTIPESKNNEISITITVHTNYIPYKNLKIQITRNQDWQVFNQWNLYLNEELVTEKHGLLVTSDYIIFQLNNTQQAAYLVFQLIGTKSSLIQISTSTVILGTGTLILTICSIILLLKKKSDISLDIQV
ncbi:MAG: hypothetical protein FK731_13505 [Asgard group archaeon]|nr:hypothetical protein [Asgard group archaeon]